MSKTNLFGTDGIRGIVCEYLTPSLAYKVGKVLAIMTKEQNGTQILIGGDTRKSTDMLKYSLVSGILSHGIDVVDAGESVPLKAFIVYVPRSNSINWPMISE